MVLHARYACLVSQVAITIAFQPVVPLLAPFAAIGLAMRYWLEKSAFLRGQLVRQPELSFRTSSRMISAAGSCIWVGIVMGSALAVWVFGEEAFAGVKVQQKNSFLSRALTVTALPAFAVLCLSLLIPVSWSLLLLAKWLCPAPLIGEGKGEVNYQEAWLIMTHNGQICTYQLRDMPADHGASVLDSLQQAEGKITERGAAVAAPSYLSREGDLTPSLAAVGDKAPTRSKAKIANNSMPNQAKTPPKDLPKDPQADYWSQLRSVAAGPTTSFGKSSEE
jgi:hypothetical protein